MHELALAEAIVRICREHARGRRVTRVDVAVGCLRQVVPRSLEFCFGLVATGTELEGAELSVVHVPVRVACDRCGTITTVDGFPLACTGCGALEIEVVAGEECRVEGIEVEEPAACTG